MRPSWPLRKGVLKVDHSQLTSATGRHQGARRGAYHSGFRIGKRPSLGKVSSLGSLYRDPGQLAIDLSQLLGGKQFTVSCNLVFNGYGFKTSALADTRANGYVLISTKYA